MALNGDFGTVSSPRSDAVSSINLTFNRSVTNVSLSDFTLARDGVNVPLTGVVLSGSGSSYTLSGLAPLTHQRNAPPTPDYVLTLVAAGSGIMTNDGPPVEYLSSNITRQWTMVVAPWDGAVNCLRSAPLQHQNVLSTAVGGALWPLDISTLTNSGGEYLVTLTAAFPPNQDYTVDDWVSIEGQSGATGAAGFWKIAGIGANSFRLVGSTYVNNGSGGKAYRWLVGRWDAIAALSLSGAAKRGSQLGNNSFYDTNYYVPYNLATNIKKGPPVDARTASFKGRRMGTSTKSASRFLRMA